MRMWLAMEEGTWRLAGIICIQSHIRKHKEVKTFQSIRLKVAKIQAAWRGYRDFMNYLHVLADILIVQSIVRRRLAITGIKQMVVNRRINAAVSCIFVTQIFVALHSYNFHLHCFFINRQRFSHNGDALFVVPTFYLTITM